MARGFLFSYESSAAGIGIAAAVVVAATAAAAAAPAAVAAAAPNDDQQNDDPAAVATAKAVITHIGTSYEIVDRPNRPQSIVCGPAKVVPDLFSGAGDQGLSLCRLPGGVNTLVDQQVTQGFLAVSHHGIQRVVGDIDQVCPQEGAALERL